MIYAQCFILLIIIVSFFMHLNYDINGRPAKEPKGFNGVVSTVVSIAITVIIYYIAGAFSKIF